MKVGSKIASDKMGAFLNPIKEIAKYYAEN